MVIKSLISELTQLNLKAPVWQGILLGALGALCLSPSVRAAESLTLEYGAEVRTFPVSNLETFVSSGQAQDPELQAFFERHPEARRIVQDLFSAEIYISPTFLERVEQGAKSPTIDFILIQLNKLISSPSLREDVQPLRTAIINSLEDNNRLSLLELIRDYPVSDIQINLTGLEPIYNDVKAFVEKVLPALEVAKEFLQERICDCPTQSAQSSDNRQSRTDSTTVLTATQSTNCPPSQTTVQSQPEQPEVQTQATLVEPAVAQPAQR